MSVQKKQKRAALTVIDAMFQNNVTAIMTYPALEAARAEKRSEGDTAFLQAELFMKAEEMNDTHHVPMVVHGIVSVSDFKDEKEPSPVVASYLSFAKDFADSSLRGRVGKAARKNLNEQKVGTDADEYIENHLAGLLPASAVPPSRFKHLVSGDTDIADFQAECGLMNFGMKTQSVHISSEKSNLAAARLCVKGTRRVGVIGIEELQQFLAKKGLYGVDLKNFLKDVREEGVASFLSASVPMYVATLGPGDMLITPSDVITLEEVTSDDDVFGVKCNFINSCDKKSMDSIKAETAKPSTLSSAPCKLVMNIVRQSAKSTAVAPP